MGDVLCPVVVGREAELSALADSLAAAAGGAGGLVFLIGEPGIGKSRLARELAGRARSAGAGVATGRAVPSGTSTAYWPLTEALLQALADRPFPADEDLAPWLPALGAALPGLAGLGGPAATAWPGREAPGQDQALVAVRGEAVLRLLGHLAGPGGLAVVLEDLQWADPDTLAVTEYLADNLSGQRVLCLATCRPEPPSAALALIRRLYTRRSAAHIALGRLDDGQVADMVRACVPGAGQEAIDRVRRAADGVPFLVEEVLASPGVPASFRDTVRARLAEAGPEQRAVLEAAAVLGRHFDWRLLMAVTGQVFGGVASALARGVDLLLLTSHDDGFSFRHALTREAVAQTLLPPRRAALAGAALAAVENAHPGLPPPWGDVAADLAVQAGDRSRAGALLAASGGASLERGALATAITTLGRAVVMLTPGPELIAAEECLVEALALAGRTDEAMAVGDGLIHRLGTGAATARTRAAVHVRLAHAAVAATRWPIAGDHLAAAGALLAASPDPPLSAQVAVLTAEVALAAGNAGLAAARARGALACPQPTPAVQCQALEIIGRAARGHDLAVARAAFERALAVAESAELPFWRLRALHQLGTIELFSELGTTRLRQARRTASELGALGTAAVLDLQLAAAADSRFEHEQAAGHARDCLAISERLGLGQARAKALYFLAESAALRGDRAESEHFIALTLAAAGDDTALEAFCWGGCRGMLAVLEDDRERAVADFRRAATALRDCPGAEPASFRGLWPLVLAATGGQDAELEIERGRRSGITIAFANAGLLDYAEAILAGRGGDQAGATRLAAAAERLLAPFLGWADLARMYAGEAALADGWGEPRRWLAAARDAFAARGLARLARRCGGLLAGPAPGRWRELGVTAREADVLALVAEGLANKQIAARLSLSPRTVEKHVGSLLRKTGARSRAQLVAIVGRAPGGGQVAGENT